MSDNSDGVMLTLNSSMSGNKDNDSKNKNKTNRKK